MLKVFLVEDEVIVRNSIKKNIPWEEEGFVFVGEARDGELAFPMIQETQPDIVITDIRMPFMNGLELSRLIRQEMPWVKIIVLSGYDEFAYAKEAITIGVAEYLLKPVDVEQIMNTLRNVGGTILKEREKKMVMERFQIELQGNMREKRMQFFRDILGRTLSYSDLIRTGKEFGMDMSAPMYSMILIQFFGTEEESYNEESVRAFQHLERIFFQRKDAVLFERGTEGYAILVKGSRTEEIEAIEDFYIDAIEEMLMEYKSIEYFAGVGEKIERLGEAKRAFHTANQMFCYRYMKEKNQVLYFDREKPEIVAPVKLNLSDVDVSKISQKAVEKFLKSGSNNEIQPFVEELFVSIGEDNLNSFLLRQYLIVEIHLTILRFLEDLLGQKGVAFQDGEDIGEVVARLDTVEKAKSYMVGILGQALVLRNEQAQNRYGGLIEMAKSYIKEHYNVNDISLNLVASHVNVSPSHFSSIFSQEVGKTFSEYLTFIRIEKARELLRSSNRKCSEIGYEVGYKDSHYFYYIFKKIEGVTPTEYRAKGCE